MLTTLEPGINATAGGVVAYGLTKMIRMINHGTILQPLLLEDHWSNIHLGGTTTTININTAVHYGKIKVAKYLNYGIIIIMKMRHYAPGNNLL
jgi:hypothetical protein